MDAPLITLAYANPRGGQPLGSLFTVEELPDGVVLSKPVPPSSLTAATAGLVGLLTLCFALAAIFGICDERGDHRSGGEWALIVGVIVVLLGLGYICLAHAWFLAQRRTLHVSLRGRHLTVANGLWTLGGRPWHTTSARRFTVTVAQPDVVRRRLIAGVIVHSRFGFTRAFLTNLPKDECIWIAGLLNDALPRSRATVGTHS